MTNVLCSGRMVSYLPGLHVLVHRVVGARAVSVAQSSSSGERYIAITPSDIGLQFVNHDGSMVPHGPEDFQVQFLGHADFDCHFEGHAEPRKSLIQKMVPDGLCASPTTDRHKLIVSQVIGEFIDRDHSASSQNSSKAKHYFDKSTVECAIQTCPELLKKDFRSMFPEAPSCDMLVVTVTQKTANNMMSWCAAVEQEREQMLGRFVDGAKKICYALQRDGFWADFIDPSSGLAFFGSYTNNTLFETDERYRHLGFGIEDLGCCRVIRHSLWGTHIFVGTLFTNAPPNSLIMRNLQGS